MRYLCTNCNFLYDEDLWDKEDNIKPWTKFYNLGDSYVCPVCWELPDIFHEIIDEINYLWDWPEDFIEVEHFIDIEDIDENTIRTSVWKWNLHSSWEEHRITSIWLYDEYGDLVIESFFNAWMDPEIEFDISDLDDYEVRVRCSLHGVWGRKIKS